MEVATGFLIAIAIGLTGVGGGVLTAPILILFMGLPAAESVGTSLVFVAVVKTFAVPFYLWRKQVNFRILAYLLAGGIPGVLAGSFILKRVDSSGLNWLVLTAVGLTVLISATLNVLRYAFQQERPVPDERPRTLALLAACIGVELGISSAGAGALGTLALLHFSQLAPSAVVGTDLLFGFVLSGVGGGFHLAAGTLNTAILIRMTCGGIAGAILGAHLATVLPTRKLRLALSVWLVVLGAQLFYRGLASGW
jgi:uncharacterized membrane protein YfcA